MEQRRGRGYPLKSRLREPTNQLRPSSHFHRVVRDCSLWYSAALFAYIGVSTGNSWARSRNKRAAYLFFDTPPLGYQAVCKGGEKVELHTPLFWNQVKNPAWYDQVTDIFVTQTARRIDLIYKLSPSF